MTNEKVLSVDIVPLPVDGDQYRKVRLVSTAGLEGWWKSNRHKIKVILSSRDIVE